MKYTSMLDDLNNCVIGHDDCNSVEMNFLCNYYPLAEKDYFQLKQKGKILYNFFGKVISLYEDAVKNKRQDILAFFENGILRNKRARQLHRKVFLMRKQRPPLFFRVDTPDLDRFVEIHWGIRGLGHIYAFRNFMDKYYGKSKVLNYKRLQECAAVLSELLENETQTVYFYKNSKKFNETIYFFHTILENSKPEIIDTWNKTRMIYSHGRIPEEIKNLLKRDSSPSRKRLLLLQVCPRHFFSGMYKLTPLCWNAWLQKIYRNRWFDITQNYLNKIFFMEPPPNLLFEEKIFMALLWDERYKDYFSDEERNLFPRTYIIRKGAVMNFNARSYTLGDIISLPASSRSFIVKYAGLKMSINWGSHAVHRVTGLTRKQTESLLQMAVNSYERFNEPWILQEDVSAKDNVKYFDINSKTTRNEYLYRLFRPHFVLSSEDTCFDIHDIEVIFRKRYKVHKQKDSVFGLVTVD